MKKLLILLLFVFSLTAVAQDKRVAILNPEAATSEVTTIHRSMIRGEMEKAICRQSGYTAFTRQDIDQIAKELNFQQSGMVDDNTRKRLGEMKGVDYLCVTRITKEENSYYLEAKFVDVESGTILNPATKYGELTGGSLASMLAACEELAAELVENKSEQYEDAYDAYIKSEPCGLANKTIVVRKGISYDQLFRLITWHIGEEFEAWEILDRDAAWLRTCWIINNFANITIRTRIDVKVIIGQDNDLRCCVKLESEYASRNCDREECYQQWDRVLKVYNQCIQNLFNKIR